MKLSRTQFVLVSFMLFSLFFGAGNLIFPPFLGQNSAGNTMIAMVGFCITAVCLPVAGVYVVAKFNGLQALGSKVNKYFAFIFTLLIYLSIGPGLGIPRAASLPFEMAIAPYLNPDSPLQLYMVIFSITFFSIALWLSYTPSKLISRVGKVLTPSLLILIIFLFVSFIFGGKTKVGLPTINYEHNSLVQGFLDGYQTMDTIAALNFGLVISTTLKQVGLKESKDILHYTKVCGIVAGTILAIIYIMLSTMGSQVSGLYPLHENGAWTLRYIVNDLFGSYGAFLMASIFSLACLTTCVGLITSISTFFTSVFKKVSYHTWTIIITVSSCLICNLGLNAILAISIPVLNAIYPISIVLIVLGLLDENIKQNKYAYPVTICGVGVISVLHAIETSKIAEFTMLHIIPLYKIGMGWVIVALVLFIVSFMIPDKK